VLASGCSNVSSEERLCRTSVSATLLNPETAEFHDFKQMSPSEFERAASQMAMDARAVSAGQDLVEQNRASFEAVGREMAQGLSAKGASFYSLRVRADGRLGNKVTALQLCAASKGECSCLGPESF
jgi:hypothetical protein